MNKENKQVEVCAYMVINEGMGNTTPIILSKFILGYIVRKEFNQELKSINISEVLQQIRKIPSERFKQLQDEAEAEVKRLGLPQTIKAYPVEPMSTPADNFNGPRPVAVVEYVLRLFLKEKDKEVVGGDLFEKYDREIERRGKRRADLWLYCEVARSVWPFFMQLVKRVNGRIVLARRAD